MTPEARLSAAAEILEHYLAGVPAEKLLTNWARASRFAGSKDRAAVRDHVFDAIRRRRSAAWLGGSETGRGLIIGLLRARGEDPAAFLTGEGYALDPLRPGEDGPVGEPPEAVRLDCPDWLVAPLRESLGPEFGPIMERMQDRADLFLRVNIARGGRSSAISALAEEDISCVPHPLCDTALQVREGARKVRNSKAFRSGLVEVQDVASQAVAAAVPIPTGGKVLDYCAGGGGKALALAARGARDIVVHDADPARMRDIPSRARRAGLDMSPRDLAGVQKSAPYDLVVTDVPCSGSGAWRRQPEAKWRLSEAELQRLAKLQQAIMKDAAALTGQDGCLAYMTCSMLRRENADQVRSFLSSNQDWRLDREESISPMLGGDGFYLAILRRYQ